MNKRWALTLIGLLATLLPRSRSSVAAIGAPLSASGTKLALAEFEALRSELLSLITESRTLELSALGAVGAIWTWLLTTTAPLSVDEFSLGAYIPLMLTLLAGLRSLAIYWRIKDIGAYLTKIEKQFYATSGWGWEQFRFRRRALIARTSIAFWILLLLSTVAAKWKAECLAGSRAGSRQETVESRLL